MSIKIKEILDEISAEGGDNMKMKILGKYADIKILEKVLYLALSKRIKFYIKKIPAYDVESVKPFITLDHALLSLKVLSDREKTGYDGVRFLKDLLANLSEDDANVLERVIKKDIKIGMGTTNINKIFDDLIEKTPYMGAKSFSQKLAVKFFEKGKKAKSDVKMDGRYANALIKGGEVQLESRGGETTYLQGSKFMEELSQFDDYVLNGELTMKHENIARYEANGIISSLVDIGKKRANDVDVTKKLVDFEKKHMPYQEALDSIIFTCWDVISFDEYFERASKTPYSERWETLKGIIDKTTMVELVEFKIVSSYAEAMAHFVEMLERGEEGTILKSLDGGWKNGKPNHQMKMKLNMDVDLRITGFEYGEKGTKNEKVISTINCESSDGIVKSNTSNMKEVTMKFVTENMDDLMGTIIEVQSCGLSQNSKGEYALLHPSFKSFRDDKDDCDSLESIKDIEQMAKELGNE